MIELSEQCIVLELESTNKEELLGEMAEAARRRYPELNSKFIQQVLMERLAVDGKAPRAGLGDRLAAPHLHHLTRA